MWDTQGGAWVSFGRYDPRGAVSRWALAARAQQVALRMNGCSPEERRRWTRLGLP